MTMLILYLLLAVGVSFICSISEAVLLSIQPSYVLSMEKKGKAKAKLIRKLKDNPDRPLAAILTANTIAHTVGAAGVGAQSAIVFGSEYIGLTSAILTLLILFFSEIIPKTLGATHWKRLAPGTAIVIVWLTRLFYPFVVMSVKLTRLMSSSDIKHFSFSRDEMEAMAELGAKQGVLETNEYKIISNMIRLRQIKLRDIMTPRPVLFSVSADMSVQEFFSAHSSEPFSRILMYGQNTDDVLGYALKADLFQAQANDEFDRKLLDFKREPLIFPDHLTASEGLNQLVGKHSHIGLIIDEYGTLCGLVTLEDVMETLIGLEIMDELDQVDDMQALALKRWQERMKRMAIDPDSLKATD